jgi:hypothetical protein
MRDERRGNFMGQIGEQTCQPYERRHENLGQPLGRAPSAF